MVGLISGASFFSFFGQVFNSRAYQLEKAARVAPTNYIWIVIGVFSDLVIFDTKFYWTDIVGCVMVVGVTFVTTLLKAFGVI